MVAVRVQDRHKGFLFPTQRLATVLVRRRAHIVGHFPIQAVKLAPVNVSSKVEGGYGGLVGLGGTDTELD